MTRKTLNMDDFPTGELNKKIQLSIKGVGRHEGFSGPSTKGDGQAGKGYAWKVEIVRISKVWQWDFQYYEFLTFC